MHADKSFVKMQEIKGCMRQCKCKKAALVCTALCMCDGESQT